MTAGDGLAARLQHPHILHPHILPPLDSGVIDI
jgi:hypothetical protein